MPSKYSFGHQVGIQWVNDAVTDDRRTSTLVEEMNRLELCRDEMRSDLDWETLFSEDIPSAYTIAEQFFFIIEPDGSGDRTAATDFWEFICGADWARLTRNSEFVRGFAEGALDAWQEANAKL